MTIPAGTRIRQTARWFQTGTVMGHNRDGLPMVLLDGDARAYATHPAQLMTEGQYRDLVDNAA